MPSTRIERARMARHTDRFIRDEDGAILPFTLVMFLMMVVITGMAVDYMRHETFRAELQNGLDRGLLAAADLDQTLDPVDTVGKFFKSAEWFGTDVAADPNNPGPGEVALKITVDENNVLEDGFGSRRLTATATYEFKTYFLKIIGFPTLKVVAQGTAEERRKDVELSLVLDISGTMRYCGTSNERTCERNADRRIVLLRDAANRFIEQVIDPETDEAGTTSINIVPYAGQVNPGPTIFDALGGVRDQYIDTRGTTETDREESDDRMVHPDDVGLDENGDPVDGNIIAASSSCMDLESSDFTHTGLPDSGTYTQTAHFHKWGIDNEQYWGTDPLNGEVYDGSNRRGLWMNWGWCPTDEFGSITYLESDETKLKEAIGNLEYGLHDGTGTNNGIKWGLALLDPGSADTISPVAGNQSFAGDRPRAWDDQKTLKVIVLMTDGQITGQYRPDDRYEDDNARDEGANSEVVGGGTAKNQFLDQCQLAKDNNVVVFTIAFEAPNGVKQAMKDCATDPDSHFKDVDGLEINTAFSEISTTLQKIKLVN